MVDKQLWCPEMHCSSWVQNTRKLEREKQPHLFARLSERLSTSHRRNLLPTFETSSVAAHAWTRIQLSIKYAIIPGKSGTTSCPKVAIFPKRLVGVRCQKHHVLDLGDPSHTKFLKFLKFLRVMLVRNWGWRWWSGTWTGIGRIIVLGSLCVHRLGILLHGHPFQNRIWRCSIEWQKKPLVFRVRLSKPFQWHWWFLDRSLRSPVQRSHKTVTLLNLHYQGVLEGQLASSIVTTVKSHATSAMVVSLEVLLFLRDQTLLCKLIWPTQCSRL